MRITEEAERDVENQGEFNRKKLLREIKDRLESDRSQEEITYISKPQFGIEFQRLKLKNKDFDHRVYFDYIDSELTVFAVRHRDYAYSDEDLEKVEKRLKDMDRE